MNILVLSYECIPANIDEKAIRNPDPLKMALMISEEYNTHIPLAIIPNIRDNEVWRLNDGNKTDYLGCLD